MTGRGLSKTFCLWGLPPVRAAAHVSALVRLFFFAQNERCAYAAMVYEKLGDIEMSQKRKIKRKLKYVDCLMPLGAGDDTLLPLGSDLGLLPLGGDDRLMPLGIDDKLMPLSGDDSLLPRGDGGLLPIGELDDLLRPADPDPAAPNASTGGPVKTS
jgi:hypothetical protein